MKYRGLLEGKKLQELLSHPVLTWMVQLEPEKSKKINLLIGQHNPEVSDSKGNRSEVCDISSRGVESGISHLVSRIVMIMLICACSKAGNAQFIPYAQYYNSPLLTNPSQAGLGDFTQATFHYRRSRVANYEIPSVSFIHPFYHNRNGLRAGGLGANLISQDAGPGGAYKVTGAFGTFAYNIHLSRKHHISAGLQGGIVNKKLDLSKITTDNQYSFGVYDRSLSTGENLQATSVSKPVINSGFTWTLTDTSNAQKAMLGVAFYNMNKPAYKFISDNNAESLTYIVTGEMLLLQSGRISVHPTFRYIKGATEFANVGAQVRYQLTNENSDISLGGWYKTTKAIISAVQYSTKSYTLSASMDFSAASNIQANINNAVEFSFGWRLSRKREIKHAPRSMAGGTSAPEPVIARSEEEVLPETEHIQSPEPVSKEQLEVTTTLPVTAAPTTETTPGEISAEEDAILKRHISFRLGSSDLTPESVRFIETKLAPVVKNHPGFMLRITGHSCTIGDKAINEKISLHRAEAVAAILHAQGVSGTRVLTVGMDFQEPIASNDTEDGRQKNRRVQFTLIKQ